MIYIVNRYTYLILIAAILVGGIGAAAASLIPKGHDFALFAACVGGGLCDILIRIRNAYGELGVSLFSHRRGGHVWFIPVWIIGFFACLGFASSN